MKLSSAKTGFYFVGLALAVATIGIATDFVPPEYNNTKIVNVIESFSLVVFGPFTFFDDLIIGLFKPAECGWSYCNRIWILIGDSFAVLVVYFVLGWIVGKIINRKKGGVLE